MFCNTGVRSRDWTSLRQPWLLPRSAGAGAGPAPPDLTPLLQNVSIQDLTPLLRLGAWGVEADGGFVDLGAPAGAGGQREVAVLDVGLDRDQVVLPRDHVGVDLHDAEVRHDRGEVRVHHRRQVAVEVV